MFLHRLKLAHNSVLYRQQRTQWPGNLTMIWVQLNSNPLPHRNLSPVFDYHLCHCCCCWCLCCYYCPRIQIDPPNHRRRGCQDFRAHYCWSKLLLLLMLLPLAHPMPMSFFDATTQSRPHSTKYLRCAIDFATFVRSYAMVLSVSLPSCFRFFVWNSIFPHVFTYALHNNQVFTFPFISSSNYKLNWTEAQNTKINYEFKPTTTTKTMTKKERLNNDR